MSFYLNSFLFAPTGPTDPYWANVVLLTTGDGTNGSTTLPNLASGGAPALVPQGTCALSSAFSEYGTCSIATSGTTNFAITTESSSYDRPALWTIELSMRITVYAVGANSFIHLMQGPGGGSPGALMCDSTAYAPSGGNLWLNFGNASTNAYNVSMNAWHKLTYVQTATHERFYVDGVLAQAVASPVTIAQPGIFTLGAKSGGSAYTAYFNNIRVTRGVARYTGASYTPDTGPFPTS